MNKVMRACGVLLLALLAGCDALESREDTQAKETLVGNWYWEYGGGQRTVKSVVTLAGNGSFTARERTGDQPREEKSSGAWYVTDGEFKLQTTEIDGRKLGINQMLFFTCKLSGLSPKEFACSRYDRLTFTFRRVQSDYRLL
jgi:hypothetical protein